MDDDPDFTSPEFTSTTTNNRAVPKTLLSTGVQHWRVRAVSAGGVESVWSEESIAISPVTSPTPIAPVDGALLAQPNDPPLLTWEGTQGAASYTVEVDTEDDFLGPTYKTYSTQTTSLVVPDPLSAPTYFWRVTAVKGPGVVSLPSSPVSFQVKPLDPVVLRSPADDPTTTVEDVVLDWDPVPGAQYYQLRVATDSDFNTRVDDEIKVPKIYGTRYSPKVTYNNNQYYWQVRAVDLAGKPTGWTTVNNSFNRVWPDRPQAVYPAGAGTQVISGAPYFQWTPVQHATQYQLDVGRTPTSRPAPTRLHGGRHDLHAVSRRDLGDRQRRASGNGSDEDCSPSGVDHLLACSPAGSPQSSSPAWVLGLFSETQPLCSTPPWRPLCPADGSTVPPDALLGSDHGPTDYKLRSRTGSARA